MTRKTAEPTVVVHFAQGEGTRGGMKTVQELLLRAEIPGFEQRLFPVYEVSAAKTAFLFPFRLLKAALMPKRNVVAQLHVSYRGSFWRKYLISRILRARKIPYVVHLHGGRFAEFRDAASEGTKRRIAEFFERSARAVVLSKSWETWLRGNVSAAAPFAVVENPCERIPEPAPVRPARKPVLFLYAGLVGDPKGTFDLVEAFARGGLRDCARLEFCGNGEVDRLRARIRELGLSAVAEAAGWTAHDELLRKMEKADALVLPSYAEGLPMVVLEAMGAGLPVLSTRVGGIPDAVEDGKTGILVEPGDVDCLAAAMRTLAEDPDLRGRMGEAGRKRVKSDFSPERFFAKFAEIWTEAARGRSA